MRQKPTDGYAARLKRALREGPRPMSVRQFADDMDRKYEHLRGTSYGGVRQYAEGKVKNPRVELLRAMADVLDVRPDWLAFGKGEMTEEQQRARGAEPEATQETGAGWPWEAVRDGIVEGFGEGGEWLLGIAGDRVGPRAVLIARTWRILLGSPAGKAMASDEAAAEADPTPQGEGSPYRLARAIGRALRAPFDHLEVPPGSIDDDGFDEYVMATCSALRRLADVELPTPEEEGTDATD